MNEDGNPTRRLGEPHQNHRLRGAYGCCHMILLEGKDRLERSPWHDVWGTEPTSIPSAPWDPRDVPRRPSLEPVLKHEIGRWVAGLMDDWEVPVLIEKLHVCRRQENLITLKQILSTGELSRDTREMAAYAMAHLIAVFAPKVKDEELLWALEFGIQPGKERQMALLELVRRGDVGAWGPVAKADDLKAIATSTAAPLAARAEALAQLVARGNKDVPSIIAAFLVDAEVGSPWAHSLLHAAERVDFDAPEEREQVFRGLAKHAEALRASPDEADQLALWAALRRYSSMTPVSGLTLLGSFLSSYQIATRQCALQAIANVFSREPPAPSPFVSDLREKVELALKEAFGEPRSPEQLAFVVSAFCTAAALAHPQLEDMARQLRSLKSGFAIRRALRELGGMVLAWGDADESALQILRDAMEALQSDA